MATNFRVSKATRTLPHLLAWGSILLFINVGNYTWQLASTADGTLLVYSLYGTAFNALIFYGNAFWLFPQRKKYDWSSTYWLVALACIAVLSLAEGAVDYYYTTSLGLMPEEDQRNYPVFRLIWFFSTTNGIIHLIYWLLSFVYIRLRQSRHLEEQQKVLAQEKLTTELRYLRAQINPHVLFNGINSVYHLIDEQPDRAKHTLLTFANLLRYQLYECQADRVPLDKELAHLVDYITLEETRKGADAVIEWDVPDHNPAGQIAPMLLQPFVENAFKHLSHYENPALNRLELRLVIDQGVLSLTVKNTVSSDVKSTPAAGGVGLTNVRRRLQLIYPGQHQLLVSHPPGLFRVHLIITL